MRFTAQRTVGGICRGFPARRRKMCTASRAIARAIATTEEAAQQPAQATLRASGRRERPVHVGQAALRAAHRAEDVRKRAPSASSTERTAQAADQTTGASELPEDRADSRNA